MNLPRALIAAICALIFSGCATQPREPSFYIHLSLDGKQPFCAFGLDWQHGGMKYAARGTSLDMTWCTDDKPTRLGNYPTGGFSHAIAYNDKAPLHVMLRRIRGGPILHFEMPLEGKLGRTPGRKPFSLKTKVTDTGVTLSLVEVVQDEMDKARIQFFEREIGHWPDSTAKLQR